MGGKVILVNRLTLIYAVTMVTHHVIRVPTLPGKPGKPGILSFTFSRPGKVLEFAQKVGKTWNFNLKPEKNLECSKFANVSRLTFQDIFTQ